MYVIDEFNITTGSHRLYREKGTGDIYWFEYPQDAINFLNTIVKLEHSVYSVVKLEAMFEGVV